MPDKNSELVVLWTSGDRDVALKMVFMYALNAKTKGWWEEVTLIVWGSSAKLLSTDSELKDYIAKMKEAGIILEACRACADLFGVTTQMEDLGIDVKYMGEPLTAYLKGNKKVITF
ncbi:MAG: DsrE family protein [Spirochaetales bacterium]|nr:DsrE family protein [Spirochaetales bacterium]